MIEIYVLKHTEAILYLTIISEKEYNIVSDFSASNFISDHMVLNAWLQCIRVHHVRKQKTARTVRQIKDDVIVGDFDTFCIDQECSDVDIMIENVLSDLLQTSMYRPLNE